MRTRRRRRGQALVEFCLVFPLLLVVIFAIIDFSYASFLKVSLESAAASGARLAAESSEVTEARLRRHLAKAAPGVRIDSDGVRLERRPVDGPAGGWVAEVRLRSTYRPTVGLLVPARIGVLRIEGRAASFCAPAAKGGRP